jgi:hypothetical protein
MTPNESHAARICIVDQYHDALLQRSNTACWGLTVCITTTPQPRDRVSRYLYPERFSLFPNLILILHHSPIHQNPHRSNVVTPSKRSFNANLYPIPNHQYALQGWQVLRQQRRQEGNLEERQRWGNTGHQGFLQEPR